VSSLILNSKPVPQILATKENERKAKGRKGRLRLRRPPKQRTPITQEREFRSSILKSLRRLRDLVNTLLLPRLSELERDALVEDEARRSDVESWPETLRRIMESINAGVSDREIQTAAQAATQQVSAVNSERIARQLRSVLGVDVLAADPALGATVQASINESVGLIKSVESKYLEEVEGTVLRAFRTGQRASSVAPELAQRFKVSERKAAFIARDQVLKLNGDLTRNRQTAAGIPSYIWRTSLDERVRPDHAELEGSKQSWDDPPIVDSRTGRTAHPGGDFNCRCTAEPDIDALLGPE